MQRRFLVRPSPRNQTRRRSVQPLRRLVAVLDDWRQTVGEFLAKLDAPLIEGIDVPDHRLNEDLVLVKRDEASERARIEMSVKQNA